MTLDFVSPALGGAGPPARSPLLDAAVAAGARVTVRDGWELVDDFGDPVAEAAACEAAVGFADLSALGKLELQFPAAAVSTGLADGMARRIPDGWRCPLRLDREFVLCGAEAAERTRDDLAAEGARICDLTASLAAMVLAGPLAGETFARFCALDLRRDLLPVGGFRPGSIARTPGFVLREGRERYLMLFGAAYAEYFWEVVGDAASRLGGCPVGAASLPAVTLEVAGA